MHTTIVFLIELEFQIILEVTLEKLVKRDQKNCKKIGEN